MIRRLDALQHTATHCNTLEHYTLVLHFAVMERQRLVGSLHCNTLQHTTTQVLHFAVMELQRLVGSIHCHTLPHTVTHCHTLQRLVGSIT